MRAAGIGIAVAAGAAAALAIGQIAIAEATEIVSLGTNFSAGEDRFKAVQITLVAWFCATAVVIATAIGARWTGRGSRVVRRLTPVAAACGGLTALAMVAPRSFGYVGSAYEEGVIQGVLIGTAASLLVASRPRIGWGVAAHLALVWVVALAVIALIEYSTVYAGLVQMDSFEVLDDLLAETLDYHIPTMLPFVAMVILFAGFLAAWWARRGAARGEAVLIAVAGPVLAVVPYPIVGLDQYNAIAAPAVGPAALLSVGAALIGSRLGKRRARAAGASATATT